VVWWLNEPRRVAQSAREAIEDPANEAFVSAASVWEAAIKTAAGRLSTPTPLIEAATAAGFGELPIAWDDGVDAAALPHLHRDPFDRILIAQALGRGLVLVTRDALVRQYSVPTLVA
jgi:PIN domain nuclease of toxin-antitoxin system